MPTPTSAARRAKARTPREQAYMDAIEQLYGEGTKAHRDTLFEPNRYLATAHTDRHADMDEVNRQAIERMFERGIWERPAHTREGVEA